MYQYFWACCCSSSCKHGWRKGILCGQQQISLVKMLPQFTPRNTSQCNLEWCAVTSKCTNSTLIMAQVLLLIMEIHICFGSWVNKFMPTSVFSKKQIPVRDYNCCWEVNSSRCQNNSLLLGTYILFDIVDNIFLQWVFNHSFQSHVLIMGSNHKLWRKIIPFPAISLQTCCQPLIANQIVQMFQNLLPKHFLWHETSCQIKDERGIHE